MGPLDRVRALALKFRQLARFGVVGGLAYVVDVGVFNLLMFGPGEVLGHKPLTSKVVSVAVATIVSWIGNRYWTFSATRNPNRTREILTFAAANVGGLLIGLLCLWFTVYVLNLRGPVAANVSANGVGLVLGTAFRFFAYKYFVFTHDEGTPADPARPGA